MLMVKDLRPLKHLSPLGHNDLQTKVMKDKPSSSRYVIIQSKNIWDI
jgi:hypothetical protein